MELELVNLESLNLVELNTEEIQGVEGGNYWPNIGWFMDCGFSCGYYDFGRKKMIIA